MCKISSTKFFLTLNCNQPDSIICGNIDNKIKNGIVFLTGLLCFGLHFTVAHLSLSVGADDL